MHNGFDLTTADRLRQSWQGRLLKKTQTDALGPVVLSVFAHNYDERLLALLKAVFPGFEGVKPPGLVSAAQVGKTGAVVADVVMRDGAIVKDAVIFSSELDMRDRFRKAADDLKLEDYEREEMFTALRNWVVADRRLDPNFDPRDPDAKRLVH